MQGGISRERCVRTLFREHRLGPKVSDCARSLALSRESGVLRPRPGADWEPTLPRLVAITLRPQHPRTAACPAPKPPQCPLQLPPHPGLCGLEKGTHSCFWPLSSSLWPRGCSRSLTVLGMSSLELKRNWPGVEAVVTRCLPWRLGQRETALFCVGEASSGQVRVQMGS